MSDSTWNIPIWFIRLAAGVLTLAVPWAGWVTVQLTAINVRLEATAELRRNVDAIVAQLAGQHNVTRRVERIESRLDRLEEVGPARRAGP
jgi:hypothetical protein